jgi:hypothetical protein
VATVNIHPSVTVIPSKPCSQVSKGICIIIMVCRQINSGYSAHSALASKAQIPFSSLRISHLEVGDSPTISTLTYGRSHCFRAAEDEYVKRERINLCEGNWEYGILGVVGCAYGSFFPNIFLFGVGRVSSDCRFCCAGIDLRAVGPIYMI